MALTVNTNVSALNAQRQTEDSQLAMREAMERLASGKRINSARDDAAGLAISARMQSQISGLNQAARNANDAISLVQTAEGALQEYTEILQRVRELAIQSANGAATNADRVNLHKEVAQLQEEMSRIANTTRFNGEILLNGSFTQKDFQIGQSNQEELSVNIDDLRPEKIGAYTQQTIGNVGNEQGVAIADKVNIGASLADINNGVQPQTLTVRVGDEAARTVSISEGDDARTIADKINQSGAQVNSRAITQTALYLTGNVGTFSFDLSSSSSDDLSDTITVGPDGDYIAALAAEVNARFPDHNIKATIEEDVNGTSYVALTQSNGYDINIDNFSSTLDGGGDPQVTLDVGGTGNLIVDNTNSALALGGSVIIDAPYSFLVTSTDAESTVVPTSRPSIIVDDVNVNVANWNDKVFTVSMGTNDVEITVGGAHTTFDEVVADINTQLAADANVDVRAEYTPTDNTLVFYALSGGSTSEAEISISTANNTDTANALNFETVGIVENADLIEVDDQGGNPNPPESVRYVSQIDIATRDSAVLTMTVVDAALEAISANRAELGAVANRLESTIQNLMTTSENTSASLSRIMDADFAAESTALARAQVLQQASVAMLAQANASTQTVLRLLE